MGARTLRKLHELKCWPEEYSAIKSGARATCRRIDDREIRIADRIVFVPVMPGSGQRRGELEPIEAMVPGVSVRAGGHRLCGVAGDIVPTGATASVPFAIVHFELRQTLLSDRQEVLSRLAAAGRSVDGVVADVSRSVDGAASLIDMVDHVLIDFRKILSIASSAGDTVEYAEAIELIKGIAKLHLSSVRGGS
jgi:hypothetical protein